MSKEKVVAAKIIGAMLANDIVPAEFDIKEYRSGWIVKGTVIGHITDGLRHRFEGSADSDGSTFTITSGAFGQLTEKELDLWADLSGAGVTKEENDADNG